MKRRHFLQFAGSTFAALGLSHLDIIQQGNRYAQVLAQSTPRKLALLVGINQYPTNKRHTNLRGCVTDVELQEELLVHRFGFNRSDIIKLTSDSQQNYQPTRKNILKAFEEHLIKQAKAGDVVVFHFSGHGSSLRDPNPIKNCNNENFVDGNNSTFVVADESQGKLVPDIMGRTLFLLRSALKTDNVTMVLDSCYSGGGTRGNLVIRTSPGDGLDPLPEEIAYQQRWMKELGLNEEEFRKRRCIGVNKGVVIAAAKYEEQAADYPFDGFHAGAFTYFLTQSLWQQKSNINSTIAEVRNTIRMRSLQNPVVDGDGSKPIYFISSKTSSSDAVISKVDGEKLTLWLGGIDYDSLTAFRPGATFAVVNDKGQASGKLELISPRKGLVAEAKLVERGTNTSLKPGTLLQESSRVIPGDLKLRIGLDPSLVGEASSAQAELSKINRIEPVSARQGNPPYSGNIQYILSRMTADYRTLLGKQGISNLPAIGSIGLFTQGLELVSESFGQPQETLKAAVSRLNAKIKSLLAAFIIKKTINANSSQLDIEVKMNLIENPNQILARTVTLQGKNNRGKIKENYPNRLPLNKLFQFQVTNNTLNNVYVTILLVDSSGDIYVVFPYPGINNEKLSVMPNQTLIANKVEEMKLKATSKGSAEALIIVSSSPQKNTVKILKSLAVEQKQDSRTPVDISRNSVEVIDDLLNDLSTSRNAINVEAKEVKAANIATLSISFDVG